MLETRVVKSTWKKRRHRAKAPKSRLATSLGINKVLTLKKADAAFSAFIRARDGKCQFPGCKRTDDLQNSHYIGRSRKSTRFDPANCIALCWLHHFKDKQLGYEYQKQRKEIHGWDGQYTLYMKKWLGADGWNDLMEREKLLVKQQNAIIKCMLLLGVNNSTTKK